jgi:hypothetical protein
MGEKLSNLVTLPVKSFVVNLKKKLGKKFSFRYTRVWSSGHFTKATCKKCGPLKNSETIFHQKNVNLRNIRSRRFLPDIVLLFDYL